ncbi:MAG: PKD domain-containing protein, partial [Luteolibacter sp.]
ILLAGTASLAGTATDDGLPSGSTLSVAWTQVSGPGTATFAAPSSAATTASFSDAGTYVLRLTGSDGLLQSSDDVTVIVDAAAPNTPPVVSAGPDRSILLAGTASLAGTATDDGLPSGSTLSVAWTQVSGPGTATFAAPSSAATTASFSDAGTYVLRLTGSDGLLQSSDDVTVIVSLALPTVTVTGFNAVTVNNPSNSNVILTSLAYNSLVYPSSRFVYGTTERYYQTTSSVFQLWPSGTPIPANLAQQGSVVAKPADVGSFANDNIWAGPGATSPAHITSLDGIPRLTTIFATPVTEVFVFERGGNDTGTIRPILVGGGLGPALTLTGNGAPYLTTGITVSDGSANQNIFGFVLKSDLPIQGIQIDAVGFDATSILTLPSYGTWALSNAGGQAAGLDFDLDSVPNGIEYFMGEAGSTFTVTPALVDTAGVLTWTWPYDPFARATFKFQVSGDLADWTSEVAPPHASIQITAPVSPASLGSAKFTLPNLDPKRFTRLVVTPTP